MLINLKSKKSRKIFHNILLFFFIIFVISIIIVIFKKLLNFVNIELFSIGSLNDLYNNHLMDDFKEIFPTGNRNSGGPHFFEYAYDKYIDGEFTEQEFIDFHKLYCAVSGSPISPDRSDAYNIVRIKKYDSEEFIEGTYYRCCTPCICDLMKHSVVKEFSSEDDNVFSNNDLKLILIKNPCKNKSKQNILIKEEAPEFKCNNRRLDRGIYLDEITNDPVDSEYLIIGVLYPGSYEESEETLEDRVDVCKSTNRFSSDEPMGGMGDIFISISKSGLDINESHIGHDYKDFR